MLEIIQEFSRLRLRPHRRSRTINDVMKQFPIRSLLMLVSLQAASSFAQNSTPTPSSTPEPVVIKAGRLLDVRTGKIANNVFISIGNHRIKSVGNEAPAGVRVIDLSNAFVMPGMVDCHAHVLGNLKDLSPAASLRMSSPKKSALGRAQFERLAGEGIHGFARCGRRRHGLWATRDPRCHQ